MARRNEGDPSGGSARRRALGFGLVALLIATGTAWVVYATVQAYEDDRVARTAEIEGARVVVAATDLPAGSILRESDLLIGHAPPGIPVAEVFHEPEALIGQTLGEQILKGEPVRPQRLLLPGVTTFRLDQVIDPGSRAVSLRLDADAAMGALLRPGHFVDVFVTISRPMPDGTSDWVTEVVLQGVRVVAIDEDVAPGPAAIAGELGVTDKLATRMVTFEVDPVEAKGLVHAIERGEVHLALRSPSNLEVAMYGEPLVTRDMVGVPTSAQEGRLARKRGIVDASAQAGRTMEVLQILRGNSRSTAPIDRSEAP